MESILKFEDLPDTINIRDYSKWRGVSICTAEEVFHSKGFPRIPNTGTRLLADKRAVLLHEMGLNDIERNKFLLNLAQQMYPIKNV